VRRSAPILAALVVIGIAATVDALRSDGDAPRERVRSAATTSPAAKLRLAGVTGELYFTVRTEAGCRLRAVSLPTLQDAASFEVRWCRFDLSRDGNVLAGPPCPGRTFEVRSVDELSSSWAGCAPAWKPDGALTFVRNGDVVTPKEVLVRNVARFAENALGQSRRLVVRQLAWLSDTRLAVLISGRAADPGVVIVIEGGRVVFEPIFAGSRSTIDVLRYTEEIFIDGQIFDSRGNFVSASRFPFGDVAAVTDSPGRRWFAVARPGSVCIYEETDPPPRERFPITCLEADAVDLAWR
jgi:hypothetical protein